MPSSEKKEQKAEILEKTSNTRKGVILSTYNLEGDYIIRLRFP